MTCLEKLKEEHPHWTAEDIRRVSIRDCPHSYGIMGDPIWCLEEDGTDRCKRCWEREVSEEKSVYEICQEIVNNPDAKKVTVEFPEDSIEQAVVDDSEPHIKDSIEQTVVDDSEPHIKDSGDRTQFESGAVRDMREGKGRCDLMPLEVVYRYLKLFFDEELARPIKCIWGFQECGDTRALYEAINLFLLSNNEWDSAPTMFLEVAKHFEEGAKKYGESNWQKGIPTKCYIDSAVRHYLKWLRGDNDEPHDRAFVWNLMCCIWEVDYHKKEDEE